MILQAWSALEVEPGAWVERFADDQTEMVLGTIRITYRPRRLAATG